MLVGPAGGPTATDENDGWRSWKRTSMTFARNTNYDIGGILWETASDKID